ncbi:MAG: chloride channel protein [Bacteroidales bacterium]|nr:chloride channel protein [Bacteroidales bacterium]
MQHRSTIDRHFIRLMLLFQKLGRQRMLLVLSLLVGFFSGLAAVVLKRMLHFTSNLVSGALPAESANYLYIGLPAVGILLTIWFLRYVVKDDIGHGVSKVLYSISKQSSRIKRHNTYSSMVASSITIGFGGSVGAEAPIVYTGAAIASAIGQFCRVNYKTLTLLVACGAAGGIAAIFKAPLAGLVFTIEVLMLDLTTASIIPLLISAATAVTVSALFSGEDIVFSYTVLRPFELHNIPYFIVLGVFCGLVSFYFIRAVMAVEVRMASIGGVYRRWLLGAVVLGGLIFIFPPLYGEGYDLLQALLDGRSSAIFNNSPLYIFRDNYWLVLVALVLLIMLKAVATAVTTGAGGVGGTFAPSLFVGGVAGCFVAKLVNQLSFVDVSEGNFAVVGMAGTMAAVMHAPLTAIFLIAEITGGYALFVPLIITSTISYLVIMQLEPHSIYTKKLAQRGELITHHKDKAVLTLMHVGSVVEDDFVPVQVDDTLGELVRAVSTSKRNIFPVITADNDFVGYVLLDDIREVMFDHTAYGSVLVREVMQVQPVTISIVEPMDSVMRKFEDTGAWNLPVVSEGKYVGFVSKSKIFSAYRQMLIQFSDE